MSVSLKATSMGDSGQSDIRVGVAFDLPQTAKRVLFRWLLVLHAGMLSLVRRRPLLTEPLNRSGPVTVLLTGTFFSENWIMNHLRPLALSEYCRQVIIVSLFPVPNTPKVKLIVPPAWSCRLFGETPARLLAFVFIAIKRRPDWVGGFHLIPNGLVVAVLAPLIGARSLYFCGGGPREVLDGGILGNRALEDIKIADPIAEVRLIRAMNAIDYVICMGKRTAAFYRDRGVTSSFEIIPGGIDGGRFNRGGLNKIYDVIFVGRLVHVKRIDLLLQAVTLLAKSIPDIKAAIVGTGPLESELKGLADRLGIADKVVFAGDQADVTSWLRQSRVFVLTSDSEGLSLAMMEALTCGLPCVVADVGELGEVVHNGLNGFLVSGRTGAAFAEVLRSFIRDKAALAGLSSEAASSAESFEVNQTVSKWNKILGSRSNPESSVRQTNQPRWHLNCSR